METFRIRIAGVVAQVQPLFGSTAAYCRNYLTDQEPDFFVTVTDEDLRFEQYLLDVEADEEGMKRRRFTDPFLERTAIQRKIADELVKHNTLLLHGSTVAVDGEAYLFSATCGTGKSTHTRLWREVFGQRALMVNDDKPFLQITSSGVIAHGAPWSGKHGLDTNIAAPLQGICILERGGENKIAPIPPREALAMLQKQTYQPLEAEKEQKIWELLERLADSVPLWRMTCTKDPEAAQVSYRAMSAP